VRNIIVHTVVRTARGARGVETVHVEGHAFGLERVRVSIVVGAEARATDVDVDAASHWVAHFSEARDRFPASWVIGTEARIVAADPDDPDGCYSSIQAKLG
jgi:hypothetical protein